ncbi:sensor histidine kinase [Galactobacter caseinivorans]|uniref:Sensor-like histidine kinase SenX3 n=1 Tax=Galactobacter caseinivorans TaxID=2676123 RepID=A0A496PJT6_9MICC|nr:ATP-binding protein [Galactobacter caseinivorans]RKW70763.1 PAS domain-containing protein [Galactobacter caseinivorans]
MPARPTARRRRPSLAGQLLALQILVLLGVLVGVLWLALGQSFRSFEEQEGRRALATAETLAATPLIRAELPDAVPGSGTALPSALESVRSVSGLTEATLMNDAGQVVASTDAALVGQPAPPQLLDEQADRAWSGSVNVQGRQLLVARVPVLDDAGVRIGSAVTAREYPAWGERLAEAAPDLLLALTVCGVVGLGGSWLLSRRLKRQTLGMEPQEIAALVEHREALLHGVREGVVAVDPDGRISVLNDAARELLGWEDVQPGASVPAEHIDASVRATLAGTGEATDRLLPIGGRMLVANRRPITSHGRQLGTVTTLRDRTELVRLEEALNATRTTTDLLRAQTHEFANQLHTVAGLIQLGEAQEALRFVEGVSHDRSLLVDALTERLADAPLTALVMAKSSAAAEAHVSLELDPEARLDPVPADLSRDLITVVGNLLDNALDAAQGAGPSPLPGSNAKPTVSLDVQDTDGRITVTVADSGPGLGGMDPDRVFRHGFSTKAGGEPGGRGVGLSLVRHVCRARGGEASVSEDGGTVFTAVLLRHHGGDDAGRKD